MDQKNVIFFTIRSAYRIIHFWYLSKDDKIRIMNNSNLIDKKVFHFFFINMSPLKKIIIKETKK